MSGPAPIRAVEGPAGRGFVRLACGHSVPRCNVIDGVGLCHRCPSDRLVETCQTVAALGHVGVDVREAMQVAGWAVADPRWTVRLARRRNALVALFHSDPTHLHFLMRADGAGLLGRFRDDEVDDDDLPGTDELPELLARIEIVRELCAEAVHEEMRR